jgi:hypothetical protein
LHLLLKLLEHWLLELAHRRFDHQSELLLEHEQPLAC